MVVTGLAVGVGACRDRDRQAPPAAAADQPLAATPPVDARPPAVESRAPRRTLLARPCDGEPLSRSGGWHTTRVRFALVGDRAYVTDNRFVRRYRVALFGDDGCRLEPDLEFGTRGELRIPKLPVEEGEETVCKMIDTPTWQFLVDPAGPVYAYEQCRGMHRVDHGVFEPGCPDKFTPEPLAVALNVRGLDGKERTGCDAIVKAPLARLPSGDVLTEPDFSGPVLRESADGKLLATYGIAGTKLPGGICMPVAGAAPCGDGLCLVDVGCMRIVRFALDGTFVAEWSYRDDDAAWWPINEARDVTPLPGGGLLMVQGFGVGHDNRGDMLVTLARVAASALEP